MSEEVKEIVLDFFVTPEELGAWTQEWIERHRLHYLIVPTYPEMAYIYKVNWHDRKAAAKVLGNCDFLYLRREPIDATDPNPNYLPDHNPDMLAFIPPERRDQDTLAWCHIGARTRAKEAIGVWTTILQDITQRTKPGVWFRLPRRKKPIFEKKYRYSAGAEDLLAQGKKLAQMGEILVDHFG